MKKIGYFFYLLVFLFGCGHTKTDSLALFKAGLHSFDYQGRTEKINDSVVKLIAPASSVAIDFIGDECHVILQSDQEVHNYVSIELDGENLGRIKLKKNERTLYSVPITSKKEQHSLKIFKATEAGSGAILFKGIQTQNISSPKIVNKKKIEFIGNSITCGAAADDSLVPCGTGIYHDQHNAYLAYGPRIARALKVDFELNAVSGIGMYRNWNDENKEEPIMPQVYSNLNFKLDDTKKYTYDFNPDIVSICLGTNDLSDGDGIKLRLEFNPEKFTSNYIDFVKHIYKQYPHTKVALLTSPMISGIKGEQLLTCLKKVQDYFKDNYSISIFEFNTIVPNGCTGHPNLEDHKNMAQQLTPFFKALLNE